VPHLRIIDDTLWQNVQLRLKQEAAPLKLSPEGEVSAFWDRRRPRHMLTGKVICGACGRAFTPTGKDYLGCRAAAHGSCHNRRTVRRQILEAHVLDLLERQLMQPALVAEFVAAFNEELARQVAERKSEATNRQRDRAALDRRIANLVDAIGDGRVSPAILAKLAELEAKRDQLVALAADSPISAPALHPGIATSYAVHVADLKAALARGDDSEALENARALIDKVVVHPPKGDGEPPGVQLVGELVALLKAAGVANGPNPAKKAADESVLALFVSSVKAGPGAEPLAFASLLQPTPRAGLRGGWVLVWSGFKCLADSAALGILTHEVEGRPCHAIEGAGAYSECRREA
jgi:hypothetical protein